MSGGLLIAGTTSDAGKSLVAAGTCRWLARQGLSVAPFKAQNMSNNSMVCPDGAEIGRAQWLQAIAAGVRPEAAMNPVLLKPGDDHRSHVVALGEPFGTLDAGQYATGRRELARIAFDTLDELRKRYDVVVCEGAGSPTEINLRTGDYVNLGLARHADLPVLVVGDIDRGGVFAALYGTLALLDPADQAQLAGWIVNKFRGERALLTDALDAIAHRTGRPVLGVLPWLDGVWIDSEDALAQAGWRDGGTTTTAGSADTAPLRIAVVRLPRASNATDVDALAAEPGVRVDLTAAPDVVRAADIVIVPGSRATVSDLDWLRRTGIADAVTARAAVGAPVLGICGGYQMLAERIDDDVESGAGSVDGLGLLPTEVTFTSAKALSTPRGQWRGQDIVAYEIHHGHAHLRPGADAEAFLDGWRVGSVWGTTWHGAFDNDGFRRAWLSEVAGGRWAPTASAPGFATLRERMLDNLADAIAEYLDTDRLLRLVDDGVPAELPTIGEGC